MSRAQIAEARKIIGKMPREEVASLLGVSLSNLKRAFRGTRLAFHNKYIANPALVKQVCRYYEKHGRRATEKAFPNVRVRSIVERYKIYRPRQLRWTGEQIVEAARMAGIVPLDKQARIFNRPRAHAGAMKSLWNKRFKLAPREIHGMANNNAKWLVTDDCPRIKLRHARISLWCDMEKHLRPGVPKYMRDAIKAMAKFQRWLYRGNAPRREIQKYLRLGQPQPQKTSKRCDE